MISHKTNGRALCAYTGKNIGLLLDNLRLAADYRTRGSPSRGRVDIAVGEGGVPTMWDMGGR